MAEIRETNNHKNPELIRLLQSIAKSESSVMQSNSNHSNWGSEETDFLLKTLTENDHFPQLKSDDEQIYVKLCKIMTSNGYKKSSADIKNYWIELKQRLSLFKSEDFVYKCINESDLFDSGTDMIIIKGEEYDSSMLDSQESFHNFYDEVERKTTRSSRKNNWSYKETECVVEILEKCGMPNRNNMHKVSFLIVDHLKQNGFSRSEEQAQVKLKQLRSLYNQVIRKTLKEEEFAFFSRIKEVIQGNKSSDNEDVRNFIDIEELSKPTELEDVDNDLQEEETNTKRSRQIWTNKEVQVLLRFIEDNNIITGKQLRKICSKAVDYLASYGYIRTPTQILIRWKNTKAVYWSTFRKKLLHPERECSFFYQLHSMLNPDDKSYETRIVDIGEDDEHASRSFGMSSADTSRLTEGINFQLTKSYNKTDNFKGDNFMSLQNSSNSNDNSYMPVQISPKKFPNAEVVPPEPLESAISIEVIPSSPKRSRTEPSQSIPVQSNLLSNCSSCKSLDPVDHYCISLAHSIKRLDARKQAKLKIEIQQLMYKAEFDSNF